MSFLILSSKNNELIQIHIAQTMIYGWFWTKFVAEWPLKKAKIQNAGFRRSDYLEKGDFRENFSRIATLYDLNFLTRKLANWNSNNSHLQQLPEVHVKSSYVWNSLTSKHTLTLLYFIELLFRSHCPKVDAPFQCIVWLFWCWFGSSSRSFERCFIGGYL